jgi:hypothetical protein
MSRCEAWFDAAMKLVWTGMFDCPSIFESRTRK